MITEQLDENLSLSEMLLRAMQRRLLLEARCSYLSTKESYRVELNERLSQT